MKLIRSGESSILWTSLNTENIVEHGILSSNQVANFSATDPGVSATKLVLQRMVVRTTKSK